MKKKVVEGHYSFEPLPLQELADESFLNEWCEVFDPVAFLGFPQDWYDTERNTPSGRMAWLASNPSISFSNEKIKTTDITLVTGLSFGGSSGSPVLSLPKGLKINSGKGIKIDSPYAPPKLIGIMSGHFWDNLPSNATGFLLHSGFSYFTRSLAIQQLLDGPSFNILSY